MHNDYDLNVGKYPVLADYRTGSNFGNLFKAMKLKLSHKDLILLIGIAVAVVIAFTTWVYRDMRSNASLTKPQEKKTSLEIPATSMIQKLIRKTGVSVLPNLK